jgi:hypothetical protein
MGIGAFLDKPFSLEKLIEKIKQIEVKKAKL